MRKWLVMAAFCTIPVAASSQGYQAGIPNNTGNWTGLYAGANLGIGWSSIQTNYSYESAPAPLPPGFEDIFGTGGPLNVPGSSAVSSAQQQKLLPRRVGKRVAASAAVGGQAGFNKQINNLVLGVETDLNWLGGDRATTYRGTVAGNGQSLSNVQAQSAGVQWLGTVRARVGVAADRVLVYATGGFAYGGTRASTTASVTDNTLPPGDGLNLFQGASSRVRTGYTVGAGAEYAITQTVLARAEYLYHDLGAAKYSIQPKTALAAGQGVSGKGTQQLDSSVVRLGLNYRF